MLAVRLCAGVSVVFLGLLAGAMLLVGVVLVPFWRALPPAEFRAWFAANAFRIGAVMFPLGGGAALAAVATVILGRREPSRAWLVVAATGALGVLTVTALVNEPANERFAVPSALGDHETQVLLGRWAMFHWVRLGFGLAGFYAAVRALG
jgi:hypothetical protein